MTSVALLDADPDLADVVSVDDLAHARAALIATVLEVPTGPWDPRDLRDQIGLLVLDGALLREVVAGDVAAMELLGPGDVLVPSADEMIGDFVEHDVRWSVVLEARLAVLSPTLVQRLSDWPGVLAVLVRRMAERSGRQAVMQAVCHHPRVDARLRGLFWHLADRWGRIAAGGVVLPLRLTHDSLARLVGAQRPTVSTALKALEREGEVTRRRDGAWVLLPESQERLKRVRDRIAEGQGMLEMIRAGEETQTTIEQLERLRLAWETQSASLMALRKRSSALRDEARELTVSLRRFRGFDDANGDPPSDR